MATQKDYNDVRAKYENKETTARRQNKRQQVLEDKARAAGWDNWSQFVTALKNGEVDFPQKPT